MELIISIALLIVGAAVAVYVSIIFNKFGLPMIGIFLFLVSCLGTMLLVEYLHKLSNEPKAIDVYRGKTTLEITYIDSVAVDSVVVYK